MAGHHVKSISGYRFCIQGFSVIHTNQAATAIQYNRMLCILLLIQCIQSRSCPVYNYAFTIYLQWSYFKWIFSVVDYAFYQKQRHFEGIWTQFSWTYSMRSTTVRYPPPLTTKHLKFKSIIQLQSENLIFYLNNSGIRYFVHHLSLRIFISTIFRLTDWSCMNEMFCFLMKMLLLTHNSNFADSWFLKFSKEGSSKAKYFWENKMHDKRAINL